MKSIQVLKFNEYQPTIDYAPIIKCYWSLEGYEKGAIERIVPGGCTEILFNLGDPLVIQQGEKKFDLTGAIIGGQITRHINIILGGHVHIFAVRFYPSTAYQALRTNMGALNDSFHPFEEVVRSNVFPDLDLLRLASCDQARIEMLRPFLDKIFGTYDLYKQKRINQYINSLRQQANYFSGSSLATHMNLSPRRVEQIFSEYIGLRPKLYWRIRRFQSILSDLKRKHFVNLTQLAHSFDYFDQAHFNRDFKLLTGVSPLEYVKEAPFMSQKFSDPSGLSRAI